MKTTEKTLKSITNEFNELVELTMINTWDGSEYFYIYVDGELVHSQWDNNKKLNAIFNECVTKEFDLIFN